MGIGRFERLDKEGQLQNGEDKPKIWCVDRGASGGNGNCFTSVGRVGVEISGEKRGCCRWRREEDPLYVPAQDLSDGCRLNWTVRKRRRLKETLHWKNEKQCEELRKIY
ncbi:Protein of unknown function [Gryllus bimaculatus]|nr:Protein of unknown function [Gryllus bimaculatus]